MSVFYTNIGEMMNLRYRVKKKITIAPFPFVLLISCAIGLIFLISENAKIHNFDVISHRNKIYQDILGDDIRNNILDGCRYVYLDVGTNVGIQIRKLFEPDLYPNASIHQVFNRYFGNIEKRTREGICAVGFEPNPSHTSILKALEQSYRSCGWRLKILTETAVSDQYGTTEFFSDNDFNHLEWGGSILGPNVMVPISKAKMSENSDNKKKPDDRTKKSVGNKHNVTKTLVNKIKLSDFINNIVATRIVPSSPEDDAGKDSKLPTVLMKIDIEGSELDVVSDLLFSGSLRHVDVAIIEWHHPIMKDSVHRKKTIWLSDIISRISRFDNLHSLTRPNKKKFQALSFDDETYYNSNFDLPTCTKKPNR